MAATIEKAKADDPRELRKQIAELKKLHENYVRDAANPKVVKVPHKVVEKFVLKDGQLARAEQLVARMDQVAEKFSGFEEDLRVTAKEIRDAIASTRAPQSPVVSRHSAILNPRPQAPPRPAPVTASPNGDSPLTRPQQRILNALAWADQVHLPLQRREKVAFLADASPKSSAFINNLGALRSAGYIDYPQQGFVKLTEAGEAIAQFDDEALPTTSEELQDIICAKLPSPQERIVRQLVRIYQKDISRDALADLAQASSTSSAYINNLGALRSLGLLDYPSQGLVRAQPLLFLD